MARLEKYTPKIIKKVTEYLELNKDIEERVVVYSSDKGESYKEKLTVKLPTIEDFAVFVNCSKVSLYKWEQKYPEFMNALDRIRSEQQKRLINSGLSGQYNSTIAKLILSSNHGMREGKDITSDGKQIEGNTITFEDFKK